VDLNGKRLLVIGGAGLIGSHTVEDLLTHDVGEVIVYDNFVRGTTENLENALHDDRMRVFEAGGDIGQTDILDEAMQGVDGVFHFAALWLLQCHEYPKAAFETNIGGTFNVLDACRRSGVARLVYSSSASVYGNAVTEPMTEEHPFNNDTFYGATKIAGEAMAHAYHKRYGLDYVGLRYMNVYGPRQDYRGAYIAVIMKMLDSIDRGEPLVVYGDGTQAYDFVYVGDCARANVRAMQADCTDEFFNVGAGTRTTIAEMAELLLDLTGSDAGIRYEPEGVTFVTNRIGSTEKASELISYDAQTPLVDGLKRLIAWRDDHKAGVDERRRAQS
jgi:UDP-glucose 4-epimerase